MLVGRIGLKKDMMLDSKVLTGYFDLSLVDYNLFQFNKFVSIGHNLYSVNNIYDFDVNGLKSTKASLLRITDKDNYVNANVKFDFIETDVTNLEIYNNASQEIKVKAIGSWYVDFKSDWIKLLDSNNQVFTSSSETEVTLHTQTVVYNGLAKRIGTIVLKTTTGKSATITVTQYPESAYINCVSCITMDKGNSESTSVKSNRTWSATTSDSWIRCGKRTIGLKKAIRTMLEIRCTTNTTGNSRVGTITVNVSGLSKTIKVVQPADGVYVNNNNLFLDSFSLDKTEISFGSAGGSDTAQVITTYVYTVAYQPDWVTSEFSPYVYNQLNITVSSTSESRSGVIILKTRTSNSKMITLNINQII